MAQRNEGMAPCQKHLGRTLIEGHPMQDPSSYTSWKTWKILEFDKALIYTGILSKVLKNNGPILLWIFYNVHICGTDAH